jgi:ubiquinone/menaquinone biosynthesis C-methylase UbiE
MVTDRALTRQFFAKHAAGYASSASFAYGPNLEALLKSLKPLRTEAALDVATGTGFTALAIAPLVNRVIGIDITEEMLRQARSLARERGIGNAKFERGDARRLDYPASTFDIVTTRRATHHFDDVPAFLREARRVLKPKGRLGLVDMSPKTRTIGFTNKIEKLRDSSHVWAFSPNRWKSVLRGAGFDVTSMLVLEEPLSPEEWLYPVEAKGSEMAAVRLAWDSAPPRVRRLMKAKFTAGAIAGWAKQRAVVVASPKNA